MIYRRLSSVIRYNRCLSLRSSTAAFCTKASPPPKTAVLMMNMGGPAEESEVEPFLRNLFQDPDIIELGGGKFQTWLGSVISKRRAPRIIKQYEEAGYSPQKKWTEYQGQEMCKLLDERLPDTAPHKAYSCFRYVHPDTDDVLRQLKEDGVEKVIAFSQYPQWSCTTTGSSMNELYRGVKRHGMHDRVSWSVIDRWYSNSKYLQAVCNRMKESILDLPEEKRGKALFVFSAHSVPMKVVNKGDHYVPEVCASVKMVMEKWKEMIGDIEGVDTLNRHVISWQSKVGFLPWMAPQTTEMVKSLGARGEKVVIVVPVVFVSDHIETMFELGIELADEAKEAGIKDFLVTGGQNNHADFIDSLADVVVDHVKSGERHSVVYTSRCMNCKKPHCRLLGSTEEFQLPQVVSAPESQRLRPVMT